jgi:hypothetical protein
MGYKPSPSRREITKQQRLTKVSYDSSQENFGFWILDFGFWILDSASPK